MATDIVVLGVGGQGVMTLARWLGEAALAKGLDVRIAEIHGMSQRGGSVEVHVRIGPKVYAPLVEEGGADLVAALEAIEALRGYRYLKPGGLLVVNMRVIQPPGGQLDLGQIVEAIKNSGVRNYFVPSFQIATELGSPLYENTVMLGFISKVLELPPPPGLDGKNKEAYMRGRSLVV